MADGEGQERDDKGAEEMFGGDGVHHCDCGDGVKCTYMSKCIKLLIHIWNVYASPISISWK